MTESTRRVAVTRRVSLDHVAENWVGAYAVIQLLSFRERAALKDEQAKIAAMSDMEATEFMLDIAKKQFVSGIVPVFSATGEPELVPMQAGDIEENEEAIKAIYLAAMGVIPDPKVTSTAPEESPTLPDSSGPLPDENSTKTTSSTASNQLTEA